MNTNTAGDGSKQQGRNSFDGLNKVDEDGILLRKDSVKKGKQVDENEHVIKNKGGEASTKDLEKHEECETSLVSGVK